MRVFQNIGSSALDFVENTRLGSLAFRLARFGFFALFIFAASRVASAQFLSFQWSDLLFISIAGLVFLLVFWRWEIGIIFVLCSTSFIAYYDVIPTLSFYHFIPEIPILEPLRLQIGQGLMLYLLALYAVSLEVRSARQRLATPLIPVLFVFLLTILTASIVGVVFNGVPLRWMVEVARPYSFYLMFPVILLCIRSRREMNILLGVCFGMAIVTALLMFVQFAAGDHFKVFLGQSIRVESFGAHSGRILPPGVDLIGLTVPFVVARTPIVSQRAHRWWLLALWILLGGLLLTFTRCIWMGTLLAMFIMAVLGRGAVRRGVMQMYVAIAIFVAMLLVVLNLVSTERENYVTPYINRFTSIFKSESYEKGSSAGARFEEINAAWPNIVKHPWLGIGVGGVYSYREDWDDINKAHYLRGISYIHNAYFLLLTHTGVLGFGTCMILYITFFVRARKIFHRLRDPVDRSLVMGGIGGIAAIMLESLLQPSLWYPPAVPVIGMVFGTVELIRYFHDREARGPVLAATSVSARQAAARPIPNGLGAVRSRLGTARREADPV